MSARMLSLQMSPSLPGALQVDGLDRDVHHFGAVDDGVDHPAGEGDLGLGLHLVDDQRAALIDLAIELGHDDRDAEEHRDDDR
jgi:hypothetical protein